MKLWIAEGVSKVEKGATRVARALHKQRGIVLFAIKSTGAVDASKVQLTEGRYVRLVKWIGEHKELLADPESKERIASLLYKVRASMLDAQKALAKRKSGDLLFARVGDKWTQVDWQGIVSRSARKAS